MGHPHEGESPSDPILIPDTPLHLYHPCMTPLSCPSLHIEIPPNLIQTTAFFIFILSLISVLRT